VSKRSSISQINFSYHAGEDLLSLFDDHGTAFDRLLITVDNSITAPAILDNSIGLSNYNYCIKSSHANPQLDFYVDQARTISLCDTRVFLLNDIPVAQLIFEYAKFVRENFQHFQTLLNLNVACSDSAAISIASHMLSPTDNLIDFPVGVLRCVGSIAQQTTNMYIIATNSIVRADSVVLVTRGTIK
jgi:hypothetical protein